MQSPPLNRHEPVTPAASSEKPELSAAAQQAVIDAEHGSTGWNAYDVWRTRVLGAGPSGYKKRRENP